MSDTAPNRRAFLAAAGALALSAAGCTRSDSAAGAGRTGVSTGTDQPIRSPSASASDAPTATIRAVAGLSALERRTRRRIGVYAIDTGSGATVAYRGEERFPMCSTFKTLAVAAVLARDDRAALRDRIRYSRADLVDFSPITSRHLEDGLTIEQLCAAALRQSDNTSANLLLEHLGGPERVTAFVRQLGDPRTRLDRPEPAVNTAIPGDVRDTTTPQLIAADYLRLATGDVLRPSARSLLVEWLRTNTTGNGQIRAAVPGTWIVGDKTGSGDFGTSNDVAILWPPGGGPIALAVLTTSRERTLHPDPGAVADVARVVVRALVD